MPGPPRNEAENCVKLAVFWKVSKVEESGCPSSMSEVLAIGELAPLVKMIYRAIFASDYSMPLSKSLVGDDCHSRAPVQSSSGRLMG
jgi:hypothetical protein